jgi:hypothetical protein
MPGSRSKAVVVVVMKAYGTVEVQLHSFFALVKDRCVCGVLHAAAEFPSPQGGRASYSDGSQIHFGFFGE